MVSIIEDEWKHNLLQDDSSKDVPFLQIQLRNFDPIFEMSNAIQTYVDDTFVILIPQKHICEIEKTIL